MKREWLLAAAVLIPVGLGMGCTKKTTPPVSTESNHPLGDIGPAESTAATDASLPPADPIPPAVNTMPPAGGQVYIVQKGDGLMAIARKVYNDEHQWKKIADANNLPPPYRIQAGQKLVIP